MGRPNTLKTTNINFTSNYQSGNAPVINSNPVSTISSNKTHNLGHHNNFPTYTKNTYINNISSYSPAKSQLPTYNPNFSILPPTNTNTYINTFRPTPQNPINTPANIQNFTANFGSANISRPTVNFNSYNNLNTAFQLLMRPT